MLEPLAPLYVYFLHPILTLLFFVLLVYVVFGWLIVGGVVSLHNQTVRQIYSLLESVVEPLARPLRRIIPPLGQLDLSVFVLFLLIIFVRDWLLPVLFGLRPW